MKIGSFNIDENNNCFIIAEIGTNHDGDKTKAKALIDAASKAGVDAVKFQTFKATDIVNPTLPADYDPQEPVPDKYKFFYQYIQEFELPYEWHDELIDYCKSKGLIFLSTPCSKEAVIFLSSRIPAYKIASMDLNNKSILEEIGRQKRPVILSTGIGELTEIDRAIKTLYDNGCTQIALLHCVSNYPSKSEDLNLRNIPMLQQTFGLPVGFSDHSTGILSSVAAVALGACIIEKHFTLNRKSLGPDHSFAFEPSDMKELVDAVRQTEEALGTSERVLSIEERAKRVTYRRSLCTNKNLKAGHRLETDDITVIRPGSGIDPFDIDRVEGSILNADLPAFTPLKWKYLKNAE